VALTLAIDPLAVLQVTVRPDSTLPLASRVNAASCVVAPGCSIAPLGVTVTDVTGWLETVINAVADRPSAAAVIVACPLATPTTRPVAVTDAMDVFELVHAMVRPARALPAASRGVAVSCSV
jgi:hypothetical protein